MTEANAASTMRDRLAKAAGRDAVVAGAKRFAVRGIVPRTVIAPESAEQAAAVLGMCSNEGWTVECAGGGTWLQQGRTPAAVDVVLTTSRMMGITEYEPADLTIGLRAGTTLDAARAATGEHAQELPLDGPAAAGATVGAMLATATAGPLKPAHGAPRDQALGIDVVSGDGRVLRFGGRVVKNVAGYDIVRLLVGSHGTLGLITAAHLRLRGRPERDVTLAATAVLPGSLLDAAQAAATLEPAALELVWGAAAGGPEWRLLARVRGNAEAVDDAVARLCELAPAFSPLDAAAAATAWQALTRAEADASAILRARALPSTLDTTLEAVLPVAGDGLAAGWSVAARVLDGTVRLLGPAAPDGWVSAALDRFATAADLARAALAADGGTLHVPVPPPGAGDRFDPFAADAALLPLMRRLKHAFDPEGILAPGRFVV